MLRDAVQAWYTKLTLYNRHIHRAARIKGQPITHHKPKDDVDLYLAIIAGLQQDGLAAIVHEVIWRQPFSNANHRTATAAIQDELDVRMDEQQARLLTTDVFLESKALLDGSDTALSNEEAKQRHYEAMQRLVAAIQSIK